MVKRRQFRKEFKTEAVRLVRERGVSIVQAAKDLDVHENVLRKWVPEMNFEPRYLTMSNIFTIRFVGIRLLAMSARLTSSSRLC
jgi:hypothetical protein